MIRTECYVCCRWQYSLIVAEEANAQINGSFVLLHGTPQTAPLVDIREFARSLVETTGLEEADLARYLDMIPAHERESLESNTELFAAFKARFKEQDITLYQAQNLWLKIISNKIPFRSYQDLRTRTQGISLQ